MANFKLNKITKILILTPFVLSLAACDGGGDDGGQEEKKTIVNPPFEIIKPTEEEKDNTAPPVNKEPEKPIEKPKEEKPVEPVAPVEPTPPEKDKEVSVIDPRKPADGFNYYKSYKDHYEARSTNTRYRAYNVKNAKITPDIAPDLADTLETKREGTTNKGVYETGNNYMGGVLDSFENYYPDDITEKEVFKKLAKEHSNEFINVGSIYDKSKPTDKGTFTREYLKSQKTRISNDVTDRIAPRNAIESKTNGKETFEDYSTAQYLEKDYGRDNYIFGTGMSDTSAKWNEKEIYKQFNWDRLYRDRITPLGGVADSQGLIKDSLEYSHLMNDDVKVVILDKGLVKTGNIDYSRVKEAFLYNDEGNLKLTNDPEDYNLTHGDSVLYALMGKPYDTDLRNRDLEKKYDLDWHSKKVSYFYPGFMSEKGKVYVFGSRKNENDRQIQGVAMLKDSRFKDIFEQGYKIINMSWSTAVTKDYLNNLKTKYGKDKTLAQLLELEKDWRFTVPDIFKKYAEKDALYINALGNHNDEEISIYSVLPQYKGFESLKDAYVGVASYDPLTKGKASYSNSCGEAKNDCLYSHDRYFYQYNDKYNYNFSAYTVKGTSIASPYVTSSFALLKSVFPFMKNGELKDTMLTTAKDLGEKGVDEVYGWGLIQPHNAIHGPRMFYRKDFLVDFSHDSHLAKPNHIYRFSNNIEGKENYGLTVRGDGKQYGNVLSLSGYNTYSGDTVVERYGILNIDGVNENKVVVMSNGVLYGSGKVDGIYNGGNVFNYSIFAKDKREDEGFEISQRTNKGFVVNGNYEQTHKGVLSVLLGQPILIKGAAILDGGLVVEGVKRAYVSNKGRIFEDVLVSRKGIAGAFSVLVTPKEFKNAQIKYNVLNRGGANALYTISVIAEHDNITNIIEDLNANGERVNSVVASTFERIENKINDKIEREVSLKGKRINDLVEVTNTTKELEKVSGLTNLMADLQSDKETILKTAKELQGDKFAKSLVKNQEINTLTQFNAVSNVLENKAEQTFSVSTKFEALGKDTEGKVSFVNVNYQDESYKGLIQLDSAKLKTEEDNQKYKNLGLTLVGAKKFKGFNLNGMVGYQEFKNQLTDKKQKTGYDFKQNILTASLFADKNIALNEHSSIIPYIGYSYANQSVKDYAKKAKDYDYTLKIDKQKLDQHSLFAGIQYKHNNLFKETLDLNVSADYFVKYNLSNDKMLKANLIDSQLSVPHSINTGLTDNKFAHIIKLGVDKSFGNFNIELNTSVLKQKSTDVIYGLKAKYTF